MPPALQPQVEKMTLEQYELLPAEQLVEVFDGVVYNMASLSQTHQALSMQLSTAINTYILRKKGSCHVFTAPFVPIGTSFLQSRKNSRRGGERI